MNELNSNREGELNTKILSCTVENMIERLPRIFEECYTEEIIFNFSESVLEGKSAAKESLMESAVLFHLAFKVGDYWLDDFRQIDAAATTDRYISDWSIAFTAGDSEDLRKVAWQTIRRWENGLVVAESCSVK